MILEDLGEVEWCFDEKIPQERWDEVNIVSEEIKEIYNPECGKKLADTVDLTCLDAKQTQALALINRNVDLSENLTTFDEDILADRYITNTTQDTQSLIKIRNLLDNLPSDENIITPEGKLSDYALFDFEKTEIGSYDIGGITHYNRAWLILLSKEYRETREENSAFKTCLQSETTYQDYRICVGSLLL